MKINNQILLSICIPTYNRDKYLKKSIESIICQNEFKTGIVEIVISDNASTDDTADMCRKYEKKYYNFHYFRNDKNIRDNNFPKVIGLASGIYRKLSNDTLLYFDNSLNYMCSIIKEHKKDKLNIFWGDASYLQCNENKIYNIRELLHCVSFYITSISTFGLWNDECKDGKNDNRDCELQLWQVGKSLDNAVKKNTIVVSKKLFCTQLVEKKDISYGLFHVFFENFFSIVDRYFQNVNILEQSDIDFLEKDLLFRFFMSYTITFDLKSKNLDFSKSENLKKKIKEYYHTKPYWRTYIFRSCFKTMVLKFKKNMKYIFHFFRVYQ